MKRLFSVLLTSSIIAITGCNVKTDRPDRHLSTRIVGVAEGCTIYYIEDIRGYLAKCETSNSFESAQDKSPVHIIADEDYTK